MTNLNDIWSCKKSLDFKPDSPWPQSLPVYCFQNELLCGFDRDKGVAVELSGITLLEAIKAVHPHLGFLELIRLSQKIPQDSLQQTELWSLYGYHWKENLGILSQTLSQIDLETQRWLQSKKMAPQDLAPLRSLPNLEVLAPFWPLMMTQTYSKSEITQILELLTELILMDVSVDTLNANAQGHAWIKHLKSLRYPLSTESDSVGETKLRQIAWPLRSEARWLRKGDRSGVELKLFFSHPQELKRSLERLEQVCEDLQTQSDFEDLWSKH
jgi:hypothetical protein